MLKEIRPPKSERKQDGRKSGGTSVDVQMLDARSALTRSVVETVGTGERRQEAAAMSSQDASPVGSGKAVTIDNTERTRGRRPGGHGRPPE